MSIASKSALAACIATAGAVMAFTLVAMAAGTYTYTGVPRTFLWNPVPNKMTDTSKYKKDGPYVIGFSNASVSNVWRVDFANSLYAAADRNREKIERLIVTDANDNPAKQVADIQDLIQQGVDLLIVSAATSEALDPIVQRAMNDGIPVILVDRRVTSDNFVSYVTANNPATGRMFAQWLVEKLGGKGNIIMLPGVPGAGSANERMVGAMEVFSQHPDIKILDTQYTEYSPAKGKTVTAAMIQKFGKDIDGIWADGGAQVSGAFEAFIDAGFKDDEIPIGVCGDYNGCLLNAIKHKIPVIDIDYPAGMGGVSLDIALEVLEGKPVPHIYQIHADIMTTKGDETPSIKADQWVEDYAIMEKSPDYTLGNMMGDTYDPATFVPNYPQ